MAAPSEAADEVRDGGWVEVADLSAFGTSDRLVVDVLGKPVLLVRSRTTLVAVDERCPHAGARLVNGRVRGRAIECPAHGCTFDLASGAPVVLWRQRLSTRTRPACPPLPTYRVAADAGRVWLQALPPQAGRD